MKNKILTIIVLLLAIALIYSNLIIKYVPIITPVKFWLTIIFIISFYLLLIFMTLSDLSSSILSFLIIIQLNFILSLIIPLQNKIINYSIYKWLLFFLLLYLPLLISILSICYKSYKINFNEIEELYNLNILKTNHLIIFLSFISSLMCVISKVSLRFTKIFFPIISYFLLVLFTIFLFTNSYYKSTLFLKQNKYPLIGLFTSYDNTTSLTQNNIDLKHRINGYSEHLYFSSTVFFTVGFGDIYPKGKTLQTLVMTEMLIGNFLLILFFPLLFIFLHKYLTFEKKMPLHHLTSAYTSSRKRLGALRHRLRRRV